MGSPEIAPSGLLLDTCAILWTAGGVRSRLSETAKRELRMPDRDVSLASISVAEIALLTERRRVTLTSHWKQWIRKAVSENGWSVLPATWEIVEEAYSLPGEFHADPADRVLVATARLHDLAILTPDARIRDYPHVETVW